MRIEALSKALTSIDMLDVFHIILEEKTLKMSSALTTLFDFQTGEQQSVTTLYIDLSNTGQTALR